MEDMPPGFRFYPTEEELVSFYLHNKLEGNREDLNQLMNRVIPVVDIYDYNPWDLTRNLIYSFVFFSLVSPLCILFEFPKT